MPVHKKNKSYEQNNNETPFVWSQNFENFNIAHYETVANHPSGMFLLKWYFHIHSFSSKYTSNPKTKKMTMKIPENRRPYALVCEAMRSNGKKHGAKIALLLKKSDAIYIVLSRIESSMCTFTASMFPSTLRFSSSINQSKTPSPANLMLPGGKKYPQSWCFVRGRRYCQFHI